MTNEEAIKILEKLAVPVHALHAFNMAIEALRNAAELISWLDECISDERTTPIERATLTAVKCKVRGEE